MKTNYPLGNIATANTQIDNSELQSDDLREVEQGLRDRLREECDRISARQEMFHNWIEEAIKTDRPVRAPKKVGV